MKVIKDINIGGIDFKVVKFKHDGKINYGTIDKKFITENSLNQSLNGLHLLIGKTVQEAIQNRKDFIKSMEFIKKLNL